MFRYGLLFLACAAATAAAQPVTAAAQLRYTASGPIILHDGAGSAPISLMNPGKVSIPLALRAGTLTDDTSQTALAPPKVAFAAENGAALPLKIDPGATLRIEANLSNVNGAGVASMPLFNGDLQLGRLQVVEADVSLNISIAGDGSPDQKLLLDDGADAVLTVKNNDSEAYPLDWDFQIGGKSLQSGELQLGPHGTSRIDLTPTSDLYSWRDDVRPSSKTALLLLSMHGPPEVARELLPEHTLPVEIVLRRLSPTWTSFWSHFFVIFLLLLGGLLSVIGNSVLPNVMRKINLRRQAHVLGERASSISQHVDSYLRALLQMERKRIDALLKSAWPVSLSAVEKLDEASAALDRLSKRLKVTERLDEMKRRLEEVATTAPPSVADGIDNKLQSAANQLHPFALTDEDVGAANRILDTAESSLTMLDDTDALSRLIATNFRDLKVRQKFLPYSYYNDLKAALPGLFELLNQPFDDFRNIPQQMIFAVDYGVAALQMAFDYAVMRASTPAAVGSGSGSLPGFGITPSARERLISYQKELIGLLGTLTWAALRDLRLLVQEMRENIYDRDVLEEMAAWGRAEIVLDPQTVRAHQPVLFAVRFKDPRFNDAAAIRRLSCKWDFPNELQEQNWKICHFFQGNESRRGEGPGVEVSVRVESRKPVEAETSMNGKEAAQPLRSTLSTTIEIRKGGRSSYSRAFAEGMRFLIAFGVALAALLSGALQELEKLDFLPAVIVILALGFAADSVKNLLSQGARRASA